VAHEQTVVALQNRPWESIHPSSTSHHNSFLPQHSITIALIWGERKRKIALVSFAHRINTIHCLSISSTLTEKPAPESLLACSSSVLSSSSAAEEEEVRREENP